MSKDAFDKIAEGLNEALAFSRAELDASMVEKVARAICLTQWGGYPLDRGKREAWPQWAVALKSAKAAIEALEQA